MWADWPSLQPDGAYAPGDPASPGAERLRALDEQISLACTAGIRVMLMPYRFPTWANGTAELAAQRNTPAEVELAFADRVSRQPWERYQRRGGSPPRRALEYRLPDGDPYGPASAWAGFFAFLYERYHAGQRASGRWVDAFELVNEPNLQLWPQTAAAPGADPFERGERVIEPAIAQLLRTAQGISARFGHSTPMLAPSISDSDTDSSRLYTRYDEFVPALLSACAAIGYVPHERQAWSHHNYTDVEKRQVFTRTQLIRDLLAGRWAGEGGRFTPSIYITEGGARLDRMPDLYPGEDPLEAQAKCLRDAWSLARADPGVAMFAQYLIHADPNYDTGLLDPFPSTVKRPAYEAWKSFPGVA